MLIKSLRKITEINRNLKEISDLVKKDDFKANLATLDNIRQSLQKASERMQGTSKQFTSNLVGERKSSVLSFATFFGLIKYLNSGTEIQSHLKMMLVSLRLLISALKQNQAR
ncbi:MAG: hypothetical protein QN716_01795 [Nitrososphaeraceae archaeon]|jgi:hypothetical protein|nr:hypothetical protein [Nitrososphaeraceae archaeon]